MAGYQSGPFIPRLTGGTVCVKLYPQWGLVRTGLSAAVPPPHVGAVAGGLDGAGSGPIDRGPACGAPTFAKSGRR